MKRYQTSETLPVGLLLALAGAWFLFPDAFSLERWMEGPARIGSLLFGFVIPVLLLLVKKLRRQV